MSPTMGNRYKQKDNHDEQSDPFSGYIGFANLPNQVHRKIAKRGFQFTLMVVGEGGLGKSTLIDNLFLTNLYSERRVLTAQEKLRQSINIESSTIEIEEHGVKVRLTIVDTPGYGDNLNNTDNYKILSNYIDYQFERYLNDENGLNRRNITDNRVHCLLYFISSLTRDLKPLDIECMKALHHKVNIIPVIAKADALTKDELNQMKENILKQLEDNRINIYQIPDCDSDEDEEIKEKNRQLKKSIPFAIVSSNEIFEMKGKKIHGRMYPWGFVDVENLQHSDFIKLRTMLITHMQDLQEVTHQIHYEKYRFEKLQLKKLNDYDQKQRQLIQEKDNELHRMQDMLTKMQGQLNEKKL